MPDDIEKGFFIKPTIFANVKNNMTIAKEEIFGLVLSIIGYEDENDAIAIANILIMVYQVIYLLPIWQKRLHWQKKFELEWSI